MLSLILATAAVRPAFAQDDSSGPSVLRDTETELLFKDVSRPLIKAAGLDPNNVEVVLLNDPEINAFVDRGQIVYIQSGLIQAADNVNQLQGVIAHELGHVAGGHSIRLEQGAKAATGITVATMILGALAIAAGAGDAAMGPGRWAGTVDPGEEEFSFYIFARRAADGSYDAVLRNPEFDLGNQQGVRKLVRESDALKLLAARPNRPERVLSSGMAAGRAPSPAIASSKSRV